MHSIAIHAIEIAWATSEKLPKKCFAKWEKHVGSKYSAIFPQVTLKGSNWLEK